MIQMMTYTRKRKPSPVRTVNEVPEALIGGRQREPRENGDFLRVIVLEMNMRRSGKLDPKAPGRARVWLPPRKSAPENVGGTVQKKTAPSRWVGVSIDET
jgi:hypothetical protein